MSLILQGHPTARIWSGPRLLGLRTPLSPLPDPRARTVVAFQAAVPQSEGVPDPGALNRFQETCRAKIDQPGAIFERGLVSRAGSKALFLGLSGPSPLRATKDLGGPELTVALEIPSLETWCGVAVVSAFRVFPKDWDRMMEGLARDFRLTSQSSGEQIDYRTRDGLTAVSVANSGGETQRDFLAVVRLDATGMLFPSADPLIAALRAAGLSHEAWFDRSPSDPGPSFATTAVSFNSNPTLDRVYDPALAHSIFDAGARNFWEGAVREIPPATDRSPLAAMGHTWGSGAFDIQARWAGGHLNRDWQRVEGNVLDLGFHCGYFIAAQLLKFTDDAVIERVFQGRLKIHGINLVPAPLSPFLAEASAIVEIDQREGSLSDPLPYPDSHFRSLVSTYTLDYVPESRRSALIAEISRVSAPGARLLLLLHHENSELVRQARETCAMLRSCIKFLDESLRNADDLAQKTDRFLQTWGANPPMEVVTTANVLRLFAVDRSALTLSLINQHLELLQGSLARHTIVPFLTASREEEFRREGWTVIDRRLFDHDEMVTDGLVLEKTCTRYASNPL